MNDRTNQGVAAAAVVFLIAGAWYVGRMHERSVIANAPDASLGSSTTGSSTTTPSPTVSTKTYAPAVVSSGDESVTVANQPAGSSVHVASVSLPQMGWVAVRDNNGRVLGAGRLEPGSHTNVMVPLLRATVAGERYQVLLYTDDGDRQYDLHKDTLLMRADASVVGATFSAQ